MQFRLGETPEIIQVQFHYKPVRSNVIAAIIFTPY